MFRLFVLVPVFIFSPAFVQAQTFVLKGTDKTYSVCCEEDGDWIIYNGVKKTIAEGTCKNKKKNGKWKEYADSTEISSGKYVNDLKTGKWVTKNKKVTVVKGCYENGQMNGLWRYYYTNRKIAKKGTYKNGMMIGKWDFYSFFGEKTLTENYQ